MKNKEDGVQFILFIMSLELADYFTKVNTCSYSYEIQLNEVDRPCWLDVDITDEFITINDFGCVVCAIAYDTEVEDASTALNVAQERLYHISELSARKLIVELE